MSNKANHEYSSSSVTVAQIFNAMHPTPHSLRWLPTPAFMVPAALDVLSASKYATIMSVVPAEADLFCARAAAEAGGTILTSDSDLLVYELGKEGAVAFFNQIELHPPLNGFQNCQIMRARKSQPAEIANRLGVTDFRRLAYQIKKNPSNSLLQNVNSAKTSEHQHVKSSSKKKTEEDELEFNRFCKSYDIDTAPFQSPSRNPIISLEGQHFLGPRVSELALGPSSSSSSSEVPTIYLPFLLEDPSRASAWRVSRGLRTLAYTYLLSNPLPNLLSSPLHQLPSQKMLEVSRRGYRITADEISLLSGNALTAQTQTLERKIIKFQTSFSDIPVPLLWNLYALSETLEWNHTTYHRHPLPLSSSSFSSSSLNTISHLLSGTDPTTANLSWPTIHISAQTQAVLYSLRIIAQALQHHSCSCPATNLEQARLSQRLSTLPPLAHLLPSPSTMIALVANHSSILPRFIAFMDETLNS